MADTSRTQPVREGNQESPRDRLTQEVQNLLGALGERALSSVTDRVEGATGRLADYAQNSGSGLLSALTGGGSGKMDVAKGLGKMAIGGLVKKITGGGKGGGGRSGKLRLTNIVESIDVGAPIRVVYNQWTQFADFPGFMKKVERVEQKSDEKLGWRAQIFWSHREWESTIVEQVPDQTIIWRSKGPKGHVDGAVTFHELAPNLTRVLLVLEYYPQGLFERTGNLWRAQGRRARLELKHFRRHVMSRALLHPDDIEGWRGEIHESKVVKDHETALREEEEAEEGYEGEEYEEGEPEEEEYEEEEPEERARTEEEEPEEEEEEYEEEEPPEEREERAETEEEEPEEEEGGEPEPEEQHGERPMRRRRPAARRGADEEPEEGGEEDEGPEEPEEERPARRRRPAAREGGAEGEPRRPRRRAAARA
ncbi:putative membrane protein [Streptosporangium becharense]|uniref:Putative membrane protein n=1 Tax=Streptosporangium becharense TaxID=1816182 RepID=A0A7W9ILL2_9ACTN|nr:SRPBCC family protein [Streptosporangium becharense]MBB2911606.1 putative membrane protein [Streptosporangium becharense]MBB5822576.1 putative membrane protein [Streptosporangium becharense]